MKYKVEARTLRPGDRVAVGSYELIVTDLTPGDIRIENKFIATGGKLLINAGNGCHELVEGGAMLLLLHSHHVPL